MSKKNVQRMAAVFCLTAMFFSGCVFQGKVHVWKGSIENGDKPGFGFVFNESKGKISSGTFYLLEPDKPGNFATAGQTSPIKIVESSSLSIRFTFQLQNNQREQGFEERIFFKDPFAETNVIRAVLAGDSQHGEGRELVFHR